jgi:hypothetical protein
MTRDQMTAYLNLKGWVPARHQTIWVGVSDCRDQLVYIVRGTWGETSARAGDIIYTGNWDLLNSHLHESIYDDLIINWDDMETNDICKLYEYIVEKLL